MRIFLFALLASLGFFQSASIADSFESADGNLIQEPNLSDYVRAERTPGFSPITDVVDQNGKMVAER